MIEKKINPDKYVLGIDAAWTDKELSAAAVLKYKWIKNMTCTSEINSLNIGCKDYYVVLEEHYAAKAYS